MFYLALVLFDRVRCILYDSDALGSHYVLLTIYAGYIHVLLNTNCCSRFKALGNLFVLCYSYEKM